MVIPIKQLMLTAYPLHFTSLAYTSFLLLQYLILYLQAIVFLVLYANLILDLKLVP